MSTTTPPQTTSFDPADLFPPPSRATWIFHGFAVAVFLTLLVTWIVLKITAPTPASGLERTPAPTSTGAHP